MHKSASLENVWKKKLIKALCSVENRWYGTLFGSLHNFKYFIPRVSSTDYVWFVFIYVEKKNEFDPEIANLEKVSSHIVS